MGPGGFGLATCVVNALAGNPASPVRFPWFTGIAAAPAACGFNTNGPAAGWKAEFAFAEPAGPGIFAALPGVVGESTARAFTGPKPFIPAVPRIELVEPAGTPIWLLPKLAPAGLGVVVGTDAPGIAHCGGGTLVFTGAGAPPIPIPIPRFG